MACRRQYPLGRPEGRSGRAAQAKRQTAITRADTAIRKFSRPGCRVSLDFLYGNDALRRRIKKLRAQQTGRPAREPAAATADHDDIVHILTIKLRQERDARRTAVSEREQQLAVAHGEPLRFRRLLQRHGADGSRPPRPDEIDIPAVAAALSIEELANTYSN